MVNLSIYDTEYIGGNFPEQFSIMYRINKAEKPAAIVRMHGLIYGLSCTAIQIDARRVMEAATASIS